MVSMVQTRLHCYLNVFNPPNTLVLPAKNKKTGLTVKSSAMWVVTCSVWTSSDADADANSWGLFTGHCSCWTVRSPSSSSRRPALKSRPWCDLALFPSILLVAIDSRTFALSVPHCRSDWHPGAASARSPPNIRWHPALSVVVSAIFFLNIIRQLGESPPAMILRLPSKSLLYLHLPIPPLM